MTETLSEDYGNMPEDSCPKCHKRNLEFGINEIHDASIGYPVKCPDCGFEGLQWYKLTFSCFTDDEGNEIHPDETIEIYS